MLIKSLIDSIKKTYHHLNMTTSSLLYLIITTCAFVFQFFTHSVFAEPLASQLPVPSSLPISSGLGDISIKDGLMSVTQSSEKMIVNWDSFDVGSAAKVQFLQPSSTSAVLNKVSSTGGASNIYGQILANGQVYLINPNGILFGNTSVVNVNTLIASSLSITDNLFKNGILSVTDGSPNFTGESTGFIRLDNGSSLTAGNGGKIMLLAPNIINGGRIRSEDGQILLAAGQKVYIADSQDKNLRGILIEVDGGGQVTNLGEIISNRGNLTLAGAAINQNGLVKATSSLFQNGSIKLQARDTTITVETNAGMILRRPTVGGAVVLGPNSLTEIIPEYTDNAKSQASQAVSKSIIDIEGSSINLMSNSKIVAPSGVVNLVAITNPNQPTFEPTGLIIANASRIFLDSGSVIDVSGIGSGSKVSSRQNEASARLTPESNIVLAELRKAELRDSPLQRDGILYTKKVYIDSRAIGLDGSAGTSIADVSGYISALGHTIGEVYADGGSLSIRSEGDLIFNPAAIIDVSGGKVDYLGGTVIKTVLIGTDGLAYDISQASKDKTYLSTFNVSHYEASYTQGKDAGSISFSAPGMVLQGELISNRTDNLFPEGKFINPRGASLQIGQNKISDGNGFQQLENTNVLHSDLVFETNSIAYVPNFETALTQDLKQTLRLGPNFFAPSGFSNLIYYTDGQITINANALLKVLPGGTIGMSGGGIDMLGSVSARGGNVSLMTKVMFGYNGFQLPDFPNNTTGNISIGNESIIDVSGLWINDFYNSTSSNSRIFLNGGKISIAAAGELGNKGTNVYLSSGSLLNASGGAWLNTSGKLSSGNGGAISLNASGGISDINTHHGILQLNGTLRADSLSKGGVLSLTSGSVTIGLNAIGSSGELLLHPEIFQQGGFSEFNITSYESLKVSKDISLSPISKTRVLERGYELQASETDITDFSKMVLLPSNGTTSLRNATNLNLTAITETSGEITLMEGSNITLDPGGSLKLNAMRRLMINGSITAPSGDIKLTIGKDPSSSEIVNYNNNQVIWLGRNSSLDVSAATNIYLNSFGLSTGSVMNGGQITIDAYKGSVVSESGATLKMNGTNAIIDIPSGSGFTKTNIASKAGSLSIAARETIFWDASMEAYGGGSSVAGGILLFSSNKILDLSINQSITDVDKKYPTLPRTVILNKIGKSLPDNIKSDSSIGVEYSGLAYIQVDSLVNAGFEAITLKSRNNILFTENITLSARGELNLDAPNLLISDQAKVELNSAFVGLGNSEILRQSASYIAPPTIQSGELSINAHNINFYGSQSLSAADGAHFNATGDIQLQGVLLPLASELTPKGLLDATGDIWFNAASIYPSTLSNYTIRSVNSSIFFKGSGSEAGLPFSVMGELNVQAANIYQGGIIRAPLGVINLNANNELNLNAGSVTSTSSDGRSLPFGETLNRESWIFSYSDRTQPITTLKNKAINLSGSIVKVESSNNVAEAAKIDISGGGDLIAWEFVSGSGGSKNVLDANDVFAILPEMKYSYMPNNTQTYGSTSLKSGDMVYLSGGNGIESGKYLLLPAQYALLPGGYSVKAVSGTQDMTAQQNMLKSDGSMLVSGYRMEYGGSSADARSSGFLITSGALVRRQSEFSETLANNFFKSNSLETDLIDLRLPNDAGQLTISALNNMVLNGNMAMSASSGGRGSEVDISAAKIAISGTNGTIVKDGYLNLSSSMLNAMNAESLLIGGRRVRVASGTQLIVTATNLELLDSANLIGKEIILVATDKVATASGTSISVTQESSGKNNSGPLIFTRSSSDSGDGALLMVSNGFQREIVRGSISKSEGSLNLDGDITNAKSVILDASYSNILNGTVSMSSEGSLTVGAPKISFGSPANPESSSLGLLLNENRISALGTPMNLLFNSYSTLDFYGNVSLGGANLDYLGMRGAGINGYDNATKTVTLTAKTINFANPGAVSFSISESLAVGDMVMNAKEIISGLGIFKTQGFREVTLNSDQFAGHGKGGLNVSGNLTINANRITTASLSEQTIDVSGALQTTSQPAFPNGLIFSGDYPSVSKANMAGKLNLTANMINHAGVIEMPAGIVTLKATGNGDSLILKENSKISAKGSAEKLGAVTVLVDAGKVNLLTTNGNIIMERNALVDVSASGGAAAGSLVVVSMGMGSLDGTMIGGALVSNDMVNPTQGSFEYYASNFFNINGFTSLNVLLDTGGFNETRNIHVAMGDLNVANSVTAHKFTLTTDDGDINIADSVQINASGAKGGIVNLNAGQKNGSGKGNINLASGSTINASATSAATKSAGSIGDGGKITLSVSTDSNVSPTTGSSINFADGSEINLTKGVDGFGNGLGSDGKLILRAPRLGIAGSEDSGFGVNLTASSLSTNVKGTNSIILIEGNKVYATTENLMIGSDYANMLKADNTIFLTNASNIKSKLGVALDERITVIAGDEIRSTGNISIINDINLQAWGDGALTIRAANDINVNGSISAGFTNALNTGALTNGGNWIIRMVSGADLQSSDVIATNHSLIGKFTLAANKIIRTGTGDIDIISGGDISFNSQTSVIYTAGLKDLSDYSGLEYIKSAALDSRVEFPVNGGNINLYSKGNITGFYENAIPADWLFRQGRVDIDGNFIANTSWGPSFRYFDQNIGALAGGDVNIFAGGNVSNLSAVVSTNGRLFGSNPKNGHLVVNGGGDLSVKVGGNLIGGLYFSDKGEALFRVDGEVLANSNNYNIAVALGDASLDIQSKNQLNMMGVFNPFLTGISPNNFRRGSESVNVSYFTTYSDQSSVTVSSIAGDLQIDSKKIPTFTVRNNQSDMLRIFPSNLKLSAIGGDININSSIGMMPTSMGSLQIATNKSIYFTDGLISMSDIEPTSLPSLWGPQININRTKQVLQSYPYGKTYHSANMIYKDNNLPVLLYAGLDIIGKQGKIALTLPMHADIEAGRNIIDLSVIGQNNNENDVTKISAGNNIIYKFRKSDNGTSYASDQSGIYWGGPGHLKVSAGGDVNLGNSFGILTQGNVINPYLDGIGASITLLAGASNLDADAMKEKYLNSTDMLYLKSLRSFIDSKKYLLEYNKDIKDEELLKYFNMLDKSVQYSFIESVLFNEIKMAGIERNDGDELTDDNYQRGYEAIAKLFPDKKYDGNINISFSQIKTQRGGNINISAPFGNIIVGLPKIPSSIIAAKDLSETSYDDSSSSLGIYTLMGGNINIFSRDSVDVAQSRIFTVAGGDILIWSTLGDIDAGKGSKTATSAPPPLVRTDNDGVTVIDLSGVISGSGIGTLQTLKDAPLGNVYLIAPSGTVDAGDAGVRSSGNILVAAQAVANGANIQAGGTSSGVPASSTANVSFSAPVSADSSNSAKQADKATEAASKSANRTASALPSLITVEVLSLGDEASTTSDSEKDEKKKAKKQQN